MALGKSAGCVTQGHINQKKFHKIKIDKQLYNPRLVSKSFKGMARSRYMEEVKKGS